MTSTDGVVSVLRAVLRGALAALLIFSGLSHLFWGRRGFRGAVPEWALKLLHTDKDMIVVSSGAVEVMLGAALVALPAERRTVGIIVAGFFAAVFPGNVHMWRTKKSAPMMTTDRARFTRLFLQPVLMLWALWSTRAPRG